MKKFLLLLTCFLLLTNLQSQAMTFEQAYNEMYSKPAMVIVYADWADNYQAYLNNFRKLKSVFGNRYNYVELDIASKDAKFYNSRYPINTNLPYVYIYSCGGKKARFINRQCASDTSCMVSKIKYTMQ